MTYVNDISPSLSAPVDRFSLLQNRILSGALLEDVKALEASILRFGLLSPLIAAWQNGHFMIIDGRKRFAALRRLAFQGRLPRSLARIPYILADLKTDPSRSKAPAWLSSEMLFRSVSRRHQAGETVATIAKALGLSRQSVRDLLCLTRVAPSIRVALHTGQISFDAAKAYASMPSHTQQLITFHRLGPDAPVDAILQVARPLERQSLAA